MTRSYLYVLLLFALSAIITVSAVVGLTHALIHLARVPASILTAMPLNEAISVAALSCSAVFIFYLVAASSLPSIRAYLMRSATDDDTESIAGIRHG